MDRRRLCQVILIAAMRLSDPSQSRVPVRRIEAPIPGRIKQMADAHRDTHHAALAGSEAGRHAEEHGRGQEGTILQGFEEQSQTRSPAMSAAGGGEGVNPVRERALHGNVPESAVNQGSPFHKAGSGRYQVP